MVNLMDLLSFNDSSGSSSSLEKGRVALTPDQKAKVCTLQMHNRLSYGSYDSRGHRYQF